MSSRLVNVRLDRERLHKAQTLRKRGIPLSDAGREAIDQRFAELRSRSPIDVKTVIRRIFQQHPDPTGLPRRSYDVHDRRAAAAAVRHTLRSVRR